MLLRCGEASRLPIGVLHHLSRHEVLLYVAGIPANCESLGANIPMCACSVGHRDDVMEIRAVIRSFAVYPEPIVTK